LTDARVLVLEAGSAAANNVIRSLKHGDASLQVIGCNDSRFVLKKSAADRNYLLPPFSSYFSQDIGRIVQAERIDLVIPTSDPDVARLARLRGKLRSRVFLPRRAVIERCQDKYSLTAFLRKRGIPAPLTYPIPRQDRIESVFRRFRPGARLWCRVRGGAGSYGAIPVRNPEQVRSWISYWEAMRAVPRGSFTLSEYLPGRDFCVQSLWRNGDLVLAKMAERITYLDTGSPSGVSSMPALAKTVYEPGVIDACARAVRALDRDASGVFFIDVKESDQGEPCITEINAGRFATMTNIHDLAGKHNMALTYVRLALGDGVHITDAADFAEGYYLVRSVDTEPVVIQKEQLYEGLFDASS
jgi:glutathione synthase/RimK-type ligase-like ATP-grasp enzyme